MNKVLVENIEKIENASVKEYMNFMRGCILTNPLGFMKAIKNMAYVVINQTKSYGFLKNHRCVYIANDTKHMCSWMLVTKANPLTNDKASFEALYSDDKSGTVYKLPYISKKHIYDLAKDENMPKVTKLIEKYQTFINE